jgi:hypothetical protein
MADQTGAGGKRKAESLVSEARCHATAEPFSARSKITPQIIIEIVAVGSLEVLYSPR